jgi:hypothetical protein
LCTSLSMNATPAVLHVPLLLSTAATAAASVVTESVRLYALPGGLLLLLLLARAQLRASVALICSNFNSGPASLLLLLLLPATALLGRCARARSSAGGATAAA